MSTLLADHRTTALESAVELDVATGLETGLETGVPTPATSVRAGRCVRLVTLLSAAALVPMIIAHIIGASVVNPFTDPISWYAFVPGGAAMIMVGGSLLALLGGLITVRMYRGGLASGPFPAIMMAVFCLAMIMVGVVHTELPDAALRPTHGAQIAATIHRISAGVAFAVLPVVGLLISNSIVQPRTGLPRKLRRAACGLAILVGLFLAIHLPLAFAGSGIVAFGFLERAGFVIMISYLFLLGATVDHETSPALRRHTSGQGVGASPNVSSMAAVSTTYGRVKM